MLKINLILLLVLLSGVSVQDVAAEVVIGQGYVSATGTTLANSCLLWGQGDTWKQHVKMSNPRGSLEFRRLDSSEELQHLIAGSAAGSANFGGSGAGISGGASSDFNIGSSSVHLVYATEFQQRAKLNLEQSLYKSKASARKALLTEPIFRDYGRAFSADKIFEQCGDKFISRAVAGGFLLIDVEIRSTSAQGNNDLKAALKASANVGGVTIGVSAALSMAEKNAQSGTIITLKAMQYGGNKMKLAKIFGSQNSSGVYAIQNCGSNSTETGKCDGILSNIIDYAQSLSQQFIDENGNVDNGKLFYSQPEYMTYQEIFGSTGEVTDNSTSKKILKEIEMDYQSLNKNIAIINEYLILTSKIHSIHKSKATAHTDLQMYNDTVLKSIKTLYDSNEDLKNCATSLKLEDCTKAKETIANETMNLSKNHNYEESLLDYIKQNNFSIYYLLSLADGSDPSNPSFKYISCELRPLTPQAVGLYVLDGCGLRDNYNYVVIKRDSSKNIEIPEFTYDVKNGDSIYRFKYPKMTLTSLGKLEEYGSGNVPISVKYVKCATTACPARPDIVTEVLKDQVMGPLKFDAIFVITDSLATTYPYIM